MNPKAKKVVCSGCHSVIGYAHKQNIISAMYCVQCAPDGYVLPKAGK